MYIDVLFALNFMMDTMVLLAASWMHGLPVKWKRLFLGALVGASMGCLFTIGSQVACIGLLQASAGELASGATLCIVMVKVAFEASTKQVWIRNVLTVYGVSFLLGGMLSWLQVHMNKSSYFIVVVVCFVVFCLGQLLYKKLQIRTTSLCKVRLQTEVGTICKKGLLDTGNQLTVPILGTPVTVVWEEALYPIMTNKEKEQYAYIKKYWNLPKEEMTWQLVPYRSVGCPAGLLPVLKIPVMYIQTEQQEVVVQNALLGLCPHPLSNGKAYEMILNPKLLNDSLKGD